MLTKGASLWKVYDMNAQKESFDNLELYGRDGSKCITAVELRRDAVDACEMTVFSKNKDGRLSQETKKFRPFIWVEEPTLLDDLKVDYETVELEGDAPLRWIATFGSMDDFKTASKYLRDKTGSNPSDRKAPYHLINNAIQQYLMWTGKTLFKGMNFSDVNRMQVDIETHTSEGFDFPNAEREDDRIIIIAMSDNSGWKEILSTNETDERRMLERFVEIVVERDPDTIEGHNIFNFDLPYIFERAKRKKVKIAIGRDGSVPSVHNSRMMVADRSISYRRYEVFGRHVVDTYFLSRLYDITSRSLQSYGLKAVAKHFGVAAENRTYIAGHEISSAFDSDPETVLKYAADDVTETLAVSDLLSPIYFAQAQMLPMNYQDALVRGNATKIDALLLREYLHRGYGISKPDEPKQFSGGYTDIFVTGVRKNVHHCDIQSLYPSLMLKYSIGPRADELGVFLNLLQVLRDFRISAKQRMREEKNAGRKNYLDALQSTFKILINSFYGYLAFQFGRFSDFEAADKVASEGRKLLKSMIEWIREHGGEPIEIDTDGIYFVPPDYKDAGERRDFEEGLQEDLPKGIQVEFDGEYESMFSYKMKNYALLKQNGEVLMRGAALKSRGLEPFQREIIEDIVKYLLQGREQEIEKLKRDYIEALQRREIPIQKLAKSETLRESPLVYKSKIEGKNRGRNAAYELALKSDREYGAGDQILYYVTGDKKSVAVYSSAKLVSQWDPDNRDENVPYYQGKVEALFKKFREWIPETVQGELF